MRSLWNEAEAAEAVERWTRAGAGEDLALRTYSARLIGRDPELVMHGGGNTSVKTRARDVYGEEIDVLCVKGSGWDLARIEPAGHPMVRLEGLRRLRRLERLSDEDMVNAQRQNLLDSGAPNPSVEALLHAYLPHRFVDHTHAVAVCALTDQPDPEPLCREAFGDRVALVPYVMPGFALAKAVAEAVEASPRVEGVVLLKHGLVTFGDTARESYERMIELVARAEAVLKRRAPGLAAPSASFGRRAPPGRAAAESLALVRGALSRAARGSGAPERWILDLRAGPEVQALLSRSDLADLATRGVSTPDHVIRTKAGPLVLGATDLASAAAAEVALSRYQEAYRAYVDRGTARTGPRRPLDPLPRLIAVEGLGLIGAGGSAAEAAVTADLGEAWTATALRAEAAGRFEPVSEADLFDMEYWPLEQAKLGRTRPPALSGAVVLVTGAAGAIGAACARVFQREGAETALVDRDAEALAAVAAGLPRPAPTIVCDLTRPEAVEAAVDQAACAFGGLDVVISNAGAAFTGAMTDVALEDLRASFEINFFAHQHVARAAARILRRQGVGGALLFNVSKQAVNPGAGFGAYGAAKAALLALVRQYAVELGPEGIRSNAVNADRIRSGLLTEAMIRDRAKARGVSEADYMAGNLLGREVTAEDVAEAFLAEARLGATTGAVLTVDGGNPAAMMR